MKHHFLLFLFPFFVKAQFAPQVGVLGTTAIQKDSLVFVNWASTCSLNRGWQNIADTSLGKVQVGDETYVPGKAGNGVVSLGDGGEAIMTFDHPIMNGSGFDFAVFENGFTDQTLAPGTAFLELAFVEVSSDGIHFVRFDATSNSDTITQLASFSGMYAEKINNLAGKYLGNYGTPFDLDELKDKPNLDVNRISHVKIIDVVGSMQSAYATLDVRGIKINDPWPTPFASGGFDLDAVGVIHQDISLTVNETFLSTNIQLFPNPVEHNQPVSIQYKSSATPQIVAYDITGKKVALNILSSTPNESTIQFCNDGIYQLVLTDKNESVSKRISVY